MPEPTKIDDPFSYVHAARTSSNRAREELFEGMKHMPESVEDEVLSLYRLAKDLTERLDHVDKVLKGGHILGREQPAVEGTSETAHSEHG